MRKAFEKIDLDNDGVIEKHELIGAFESYYGGHLIDANSILKIVDINNSGKIDYTEFLVAASSEEALLK